MNLDQLRKEIDEIDDQLMHLFKKRMQVSVLVGEYKKQHQLPILDQDREQALISRRKMKLDDQTLWPYYEAFIKEILKLSKEVQK